MKKTKPKKPKKPTEKQTEKQIRVYGLQLADFLRSDPDYAWRLDNEGSANW